MAEYGRNIGMAFQIVDDLLDFTASESVLGKPVGGDLREGKVTLPLIYLLAQSSRDKYQKIASLVGQRTMPREEWNELLDLLDSNAIPSRIKEMACSYTASARQCLEGIPDSPYKRALLILPEFIIHREH